MHAYAPTSRQAPAFRLPASSEERRIAFLLARDGPQAACAWVRRTLAIYRAALASPKSHAALPAYRALFESSIREFEAWLQRATGNCIEIETRGGSR